MKVYRFAIHPVEGGFHFLECISDPKLFTQVKSVDDALYMARDVIECMYGHKDVLIEFVIPPDVFTKHERKQSKPARAKSRRRIVAA